MNKGISLYIAVVIMAILLAVVLAMSAILVGHLKITRDIENSVLAFYAADSGIEEVLMVRTSPASSCIQSNPCPLDNGASYYVEITDSGAGDCLANNYCVMAVGSYKGVSRAIEIQY